MTKYAKRIDENQPGIVKDLRAIPGVSVQLDVNDILVGYKGKNYWYELKQTPKSEVKKGQVELAGSWHGHYMFAFCTDDILEDIGIKPRSAQRTVFNAIWHGLIADGQKPAKSAKWAERGHGLSCFDSALPQQIIADMIAEGKK